jgi:hypothetical protein
MSMFRRSRQQDDTDPAPPVVKQDQYIEKLTAKADSLVQDLDVVVKEMTAILRGRIKNGES